MTGAFDRDEARDGWNDFSIGYAKRFEERGFDGFGRGIEIDATRAYQRSAQGLAFAGRGILTQRDSVVIDHLESIDAPTLIIWGESDGLVPPVYAEDFRSNIKDSRVVIMKEAAHMPMFEKPDEWVSIVSEFLTA